MSADIYTDIKFKGNTKELVAFIEALKSFKDERLEQYKEKRNCGYIDHASVNGKNVDDIDNIEEFVSDLSEIDVNASGPYGVYARLGEVGLFEALSDTVPTAYFKGSSSGFVTGADVALGGELKDGKLYLSEYYMSDDELPELYIKAIKKKLSYSKFCSMFKIDKDEFEQDDYNDFIENVIGYEDFPDMDYDTFLEFCDASEIDEEKYEKTIEKIADLDLYDFDTFRDEIDESEYTETSVYIPSML